MPVNCGRAAMCHVILAGAPPASKDEHGPRPVTKVLGRLYQVYASLRPPALSAAFLTDLKRVYDTLPTASDTNLRFLASRFDQWRQRTRALVARRLVELAQDDPLLCPISLFRTMDAGRLEVAHTRTLAWLLDPRKDAEHGFGNRLMAALLGRLAERDHFDRFYVEEVVAERAVDGDAGHGRLDVLAKGEWECAGESVRWLLVIEAKVDSWEGDGQLDRYDEWLDAHTADRQTYRVFLTPGGDPPDGGCDEWEALSFLALVRCFRSVYGGLRPARGFHFLRFYLAGVLQDICGFPRSIAADAADPYAVAAYLQTVHDSRLEEATDDAAW